MMHDIAEEQAILERLARAHKEWRDQRLPSPPMTEVDERAAIAKAWHKVQNPEPHDVEIIRTAQDDPLGTAIHSQLSVVGWRLYAKDGVDLLVIVYRRIEIEHHPGFVYAVRSAWRNLGFLGDPRGVWKGTERL